MKNIIKRVIISLSWHKFNHISIIKTFLYNFLLFDFKTAVKFPLYIYNGVDILQCNKIILKGNVHRGMIRIGNWKHKTTRRTRLVNTGTIVFSGDIDIWGGCVIENSGILEFGKSLIFAENCNLICSKKILFEDHISVGFESTFMDTDFHFLILDNDNVKRNEKEIIIGGGTWISSNCKIMKGSKIPMNSVIGSNSLMNKDFSDLPGSSIFVGNPAKPLSISGRRLFNRKLEKQIKQFFRDNPDTNVYHLEYEKIDDLCFSNFFNTRK